MKRVALVGLGNKGEKYKINRHNVGRLFAEYIVEKYKESFIFKKKVKGKVAEINLGNFYLFVLLPETFMNLSGESVGKFVDYYNMGVQDLFVAYDDLDIPFGKYRIDFGKSPKLHRGIISVINVLKTKNFYHVRIGIDNWLKSGWVDGETYVLQDFLPKEREDLKVVFPKIEEKFFQKLKNEDC